MIDLLDEETLLIRTKMHNLVCQTVPNAVLGREWTDGSFEVGVEWTYENMVSLARIGAPSMSTAVRDYEYPFMRGKYPPYQHQERIVNFLTTHHRSFCFGGMGVGKTASGVWAADYLISIGEVKRVLIVCTKTTMKPAWGDTLFDLVPRFAYTLLRGDKKTRERRAKEDTVFHIINHDGLAVVHDQLLANDYDLVMIDESTAFKNANTDRWQRMNALTHKAKRVWLFTGSPTPKSPEDAFGQAKLVCPERVPEFITHWKFMTMNQQGPFRWVPKKNARDTVFDALQPAIHIDKNDVLLNRPETAEVWREVELTAEQRKMLKALKDKEVVYTADGTTITPVHAAAALTKYMQILVGAVYDDNGNAIVVDSKPRIEEIIQLIEEGRASGIGSWDEPLGKSIVVVPYRHTLELVQKYLEKDYKVAVIHGGVSASKRDEIMYKFQRTQDIEVILAIPDTIAHGLTLTAANTTIWVSPLIKPEIFQQANERMDRPGQTQSMVRARIYATDTEKKYYEALDNRQDWQNDLLGMYQQMIKSI